MTLNHDTIQAAGAITAGVANRIDLGDITLPAGDWIITRVWAQAVSVGTWTAVEGIQGYIQIESSDCLIAPCEFLLEPSSAGIGAGGNSAGMVEPRKWIVNVAAPGGAILNVYHVCDSTISAATSEVIVTVEFARASPFGDGQIHMKVGEPGVAGSTSDGGVASLSDIEIKASQLHAIAAYTAVTTSVADTSILLMMEVKSDDFAEKPSRQRFSLGSQQGGEGTDHPAAMSPIQLIEVDAPFANPGQKQTLSAEVTSYDAVTTGPMTNWCLIYS